VIYLKKKEKLKLPAANEKKVGLVEGNRKEGKNACEWK
jgi:hypothetical protein